MQWIESFCDKFAKILGVVISFLLILMMINVTFDTLNRYLMNTNYVFLQEMEWHLFSIIILLGLSYALNEEGHVRVDILYTRFSQKKKAIVNMIGVVIFILPLSLLIAFGSLGFVEKSFIFMEQSGDPGGLPYRFIIKALIPTSFFVLIIMSTGYFARNYNLLKRLNLGSES
ncbi:MAG: TRAP transporter small permease subunit [Candidatus Thioglobus sp.]|jgi:TRAP-type mannitol/chloroaromatic compound transport system permease small subunit|nr:TRAP transporter small permease subunit [Candidatus Pseudothioglobus aerophilus]|tara:strand:+ start:15 stop:530 length:516 start_codon:yes stop_codon:yes gene_type:complete